MKKSILGILFASVLFYSTAFSVGLRINPLVKNISGSPGQTVNFSLALMNSTDFQFVANLKFRDFYVDSNGSYDTSGFGAYKHSFAPWLGTPATSIVVSAQQNLGVPFTVKIPQNASGEYFAAVIMTYFPPDQQNNFKIRMKFIVIVILNVENAPQTRTAVFESLRLYNTSTDKLPKDLPASLKGYPYVFRLEYKDTGNSIDGLSGQFRVVSDTLRRLITSVPLGRQETIAFPGIVRTVWIPMEDLVPNGKYRALLYADLGSRNTVTKTFKFGLTDVRMTRMPEFKTDASEIDLTMNRIRQFLGFNLKLNSLDFRKTGFKASITGMRQTKAGNIIEAPLNGKIFGNLKVYPDSFTIYPYSQRISRVAGEAPSTMPVNGQYYALLKITASIPNGKVPRVLEIPVILNTGKLTRSASPEDLSVTQAGTRTRVSLDVTNTGNAYTDYHGKIFVSDANGKSLLPQPVQIGEGRIYSGFTVAATAILPLRIKSGDDIRILVDYSVGQDSNGNYIYKTVSINRKM